MYIVEEPNESSISQRSFHRMLSKRGNGPVRLQDSGDYWGVINKEEADPPESQIVRVSVSNGHA